MSPELRTNTKSNSKIKMGTIGGLVGYWHLAVLQASSKKAVGTVDRWHCLDGEGGGGCMETTTNFHISKEKEPLRTINKQAVRDADAQGSE